MNPAENERQYNTVDLMLSMHSLLRDRYARRALLLGSGLIATSILLCAFVFAGDKMLLAVGLQPDKARIGLGFVSVLVLILSIIEHRVDWKAVADRHAKAATRLGELKGKYRKLFTATQGQDPKKNGRLGNEYERVMNALPPIPDRHFNSLKAEHNYKKLLSQQISKYPKTFAWILRLQLRWEGLKSACRKTTPRSNNQTSGTNKNSD